MLVPQPRTLVELLQRNAAAAPHAVAYIHLADGEQDERPISWSQLLTSAHRIASHLLRRGLGGERALLVHPAGLPFLEAFYGCLLAGVVAVPAELPEARRLAKARPRMRALITDSGARAVLTTAAAASGLQELASDTVSLIHTDALEAAADALPPLPPEHLAFLQYTSGSTAHPRGAMLTHASLVADLDLLSQPLHMRPGGVGSVFWVPLHHDMGLVGHVLLGLFVQRTAVFLSPESFLQRPMRWLEAVSRHRARLSGCPNFAYEWCARVARAEEVAALDLSHWDLAVSGAEPIRASTLDRFSRVFAPAGFRREALTSCYGLAEVGVFVAGSRPDARPLIAAFDALELERGTAQTCDDGRRLVGCGSSWGAQDFRIVDPATLREQPPGHVGEVWVQGPHVGAGYWAKPEQTERTFRARMADGRGPYLRTGDLGFMQGEEFFFTGRLKDALILRGRTVAPHDVELTVERHPAVRTAGAAAFCVDLGDREELVVAAEVHRRALEGIDADALCARLTEAIVEAHALPVHAVVLLTPGQLPKTTSGKTRRLACRSLFALRGWKEVARRVLSVPGTPQRSEELRREALGLDAAARLPWIISTLHDEVARLSGLARDALAPYEPLTRYGVDSLGAVWLSHRVEQLFGVTLAVGDLLERPTIAHLAERVVIALDTPAATVPDDVSPDGDQWEEGVL